MKILFENPDTRNFDEATKREWLETNGLGGWASSTIVGAHTRRYHGLLVAATEPPVGRVVLLSKLDETVSINDERFELGCNRYPGVIHPRGFEFLQSFSKDLFPVWEYAVGGVRLRKTVAALNGENTTLILYEVLQAPGQVTLELQPLVAARDFHSLAHANDFIRRESRFENGLLRVRAYDGAAELNIFVQGSDFEAHPDWYHNFQYEVEKYRGLDFEEDLFSYGRFKVDLKKGDRLPVIASTIDPSGRDAITLLRQEEKRRRQLLGQLKLKDDFSKTLALAADQFIVQRGSNLKTLIAGYHWFADWGRDTMIALPGICLATGRFDDAKKILRAFAQSVSEGMLPNRFPDVGEQPEYNTVDATLWYFVAIYKYLHYTGDKQFLRQELMPVLQDIIAWHDRGTRYGIRVDEDGLLSAGEPGVQLTWMDAKIGDWVVTPRQGKAVEINALWYNALAIFSELCERLTRLEDAKLFAQRAKRVKKRFMELFWNEQDGFLYDYIDGDHRDGSLRPNQILALSLPFPLLGGIKAKQVLRLVGEKLYTPFGLRSLSPDDPNYCPFYGGGPFERDSAYHQGTVWSWLLGPYITATVRALGSAAGLKRAKQICDAVKPHFVEAGLGTISEILDAEAPHSARGCIAQAWGVGEILRAYLEDVAGVSGNGRIKNQPVTNYSRSKLAEAVLLNS